VTAYEIYDACSMLAFISLACRSSWGVRGRAASLAGADEPAVGFGKPSAGSAWPYIKRRTFPATSF
jgi:hypothetical protein